MNIAKQSRPEGQPQGRQGGEPISNHNNNTQGASGKQRQPIGALRVSDEMKRLISPGPKGSRMSGRVKGAISERAIEVAKGAELWHAPNGEAWATVGPRNIPVQSPEFRTLLCGERFKRYGKLPRDHDMTAVIAVLAAQAIYERPQHSVHLRVAERDGAVWLDLADDKGRAVKITAEGWQVVEKVPVKFRRPPNMRPLPVPVRVDGKVLRSLLNLPEEASYRLAITWLAWALLPDRPYPILVVNGTQGSAKSTFSRLLREVIDPNAVPLLGQPQGPDLVSAAKNHHVLVFDNISSVKPGLADDLCRLATGGGLGGRKLYTNDDEATFDAKRPIILNGIPDLATRGDLASRALLFSLPIIPPGKRRTEKELTEAFETAWPAILAMILDAVVAGRRNLEGVERCASSLPRMADFAVWGMAVAPALGWSAEDFLAAYTGNAAAVTETVIDNDPIAEAILALFDGKPDKQWSGTPRQLLNKLTGPRLDVASAPNFPKSASALGTALRRLEPLLAEAGITVAYSRNSRERIITLGALGTSTAAPPGGHPNDSVMTASDSAAEELIAENA